MSDNRQSLVEYCLWRIRRIACLSGPVAETACRELTNDSNGRIMNAYGFSKETSLSFEQAITRTTEELAKEGFGVLTTIDVKETLKKKIDVDFKKYTILGACNPPFAHQALTAEEEVGMLLPCNIIVYEKGDKVVVGAFDPMTITKVSGNDALQEIATEVEARLRRVIEAV